MKEQSVLFLVWIIGAIIIFSIFGLWGVCALIVAWATEPLWNKLFN